MDAGRRPADTLEGTAESSSIEELPLPTAVFAEQDGFWHPTILSRGPWDERAQHGGAPGALLAHLAEVAVDDPAWQLARLNVELIKPVPVAALEVRTASHPGRSTTRVTSDLLADGVLVARAHALLVRGTPLRLPAGLPGWAPQQLLPLPDACSDPITIPGMPTGVSFYQTALEHRMAQGDSALPGPAAAWFRLSVPLIEGQETSPASRAIAAADFGSGLSWVLPLDRYLFSNADLDVHLHRQPRGEWIGLLSETQADESGVGTAFSRLYDVHGPVGVATQTLVMRERRPVA
ncbi:MAG TPA: thioesterase family protein [Microbacteriaceae bacterium]|nr:thioesterase family protein [Microbacteriaceae bacterium]HQX36529.1 thioesterase family protein [Microbacteriaceae bacterium]HRA09961.1 thioesterase family protein [Microbacteriaceae bacterium]